LKINIKGIDTNYIVEGEGKCVLLLHGWGSNIKLFEHIISCLERSHKVIALDMPGFGDTAEPPCAWSVDDYVDFVLDFMKNFKCKDLILLGHSFGGRVIIKMNSRENLPFGVTKVVLIDSAGILPKKSMKQKIRTRMYKIGRTLLSISLVRKLYPNALEDFRKRNGSADYNNATPLMRQTLVKVVNEDLKPLLSKIKAPTLLIWGDKDTATPISDAKCMEELIPDAGLVTLQGGSHFAYLEQPFLVNKVLESFLGVKEA
jgi:pimeloyl-ACP methyl ester carboxylesterase